MSVSIFNVPAWANNTAYKKDDIVSYNGYYYYAGLDHQSHVSQTFPQTYTPELWKGITQDDFGVTTPFFEWVPSYGSEIISTPKIKVIKFGDSYEQRAPDGINTKMLSITLQFDKRTKDEVTAIAHFLDLRGASESFIYIPRPPYSTRKRFVCRSWASSSTFYNNARITARFEEVSN